MELRRGCPSFSGCSFESGSLSEPGTHIFLVMLQASQAQQPFSKLEIEVPVKYPTCVGARCQTLVLMVVQQELLAPEQLSHTQQTQFFKMRTGNITFKDLENARCFQIKLYPKHKKPPVVVCKQR